MKTHLIIKNSVALASISLLSVFFSEIALSTTNSTNKSSSTKNLRKNISIEELIAGAMTDSTSAKLIKLEAARGEIAKLGASAPLDLNLFSTITLSDSEAESLSTSSPTSTNSTSYTFGASKLFSTGTSLTASITSADTNLEYPAPVGSLESGSGVVSIKLKQNLLSDTFGKATRATLKSADLLNTSIQHNVKDQLEDFAIKISEMFFSTRKAQLAYTAAQLSEKQQRKLLRIAKVLLRRGNMEKSDFLQIEAAYYNSKENVSNSFANLTKLWNTSITLLGLPSEYKSVNPMDIKMEFKNRAVHGSIICQEPESAKIEKSNTFQKIKHSYDSSVLALDSKKDLALPKVTLEMSLSSENYEDEASDALSDSAEFKNPASSVVLSISAPLGNSRNKSQIFDAAKNLESAKLNLNTFKEDRITELQNECTTFARNKTRSGRLKEIHNIQRKRSNLDMKRFEVGRLDAFSAIQSTISKTNAWYSAEAAKLDIQATAWKLIHLSGDLESLFAKK